MSVGSWKEPPPPQTIWFDDHQRALCQVPCTAAPAASRTGRGVPMRTAAARTRNGPRLVAAAPHWDIAALSGSNVGPTPLDRTFRQGVVQATTSHRCERTQANWPTTSPSPPQHSTQRPTGSSAIPSAPSCVAPYAPPQQSLSAPGHCTTHMDLLPPAQTSIELKAASISQNRIPKNISCLPTKRHYQSL